MPPDAIHNLGLAEVARVRNEIAKIQVHYGVEGYLSGFLQSHTQLPEFRPFKTDQDVLNAFEVLNRKVQAELPKLFAHSPKAPLKVLPEPESTKATASAHYESPTPSSSR